MAKRTASTKMPTGRKAKNASPSKRKAAENHVTLERRTGDRRSATGATTPAPQLERRQKVNRRRQIDPTTCERDYSDDEVEFMNALDLYKRKSGRMFPTCSEVLEVIRGLGYAKPTARPAETASFIPLDLPASPAFEFEGLVATSP
jgi:hypothetical protein